MNVGRPPSLTAANLLSALRALEPSDDPLPASQGGDAGSTLMAAEVWLLATPGDEAVTLALVAAKERLQPEGTLA